MIRRKRMFVTLGVIIIMTTSNGFSADFSGYLELWKRVRIQDKDIPFIGLYNNLRINAQSELSDELIFFGSLDFKFYDFDEIEGGSDLFQINSIFPVETNLWEAYADISGFLSDRISLKLGKQVISWGTADEISPTNNLNPNDLSDPFAFEKKIPIESFLIDYYLSPEVFLELVWIPTLKPTLFPKIEVPLIPGGEASYISNSDKIIMPEKNLKNSIYGLKLKGILSNIDYSFSYLKGYSHLPLPMKIDFFPTASPEERTKKEFFYPQTRIFGFDLVGEVFFIGYRAEFALFFPEEVITSTYIHEQSLVIEQKEQVLKDEAYLKATVGFDYTFVNGLYLNLQYSRGLPFEIGKDNIGNYLFAQLEKKYLEDRIKFKLNGAFGWIKEFRQNHGYMIQPSLTYHPVDNLEFEIGTTSLEGKGETILASWKNWDYAFLRTKIYF